MDLYKLERGMGQAVVSSLGGTVASFKVAGQDIFYPWQMINGKARGGCPICAPWFSRSVRGPHHGHLRNLEAMKYPVRDYSSVKYLFRRPGDNKYPWPMEYATKAYVYDHTLGVSLRVDRGQDKIIGGAPILPGFHPYFACHDASQVSVEVAGKIYSGFSNEPKKIPAEDTKATIIMPGRRIEMFLIDGFTMGCAQFVFWTDAPDKYVCVEPILEDTQVFDTPAGRHLSIGKCLEMLVVFRVSVL